MGFDINPSNSNPIILNNTNEVVPVDAKNNKQIVSNELPFLTVINSSPAASVNIRRSSTNILEDQANNVESMVADAVNLIHNKVGIDQSYICDDFVYNGCQGMIDELRKSIKKFDALLYIAGSKGNKPEGVEIIGQNKVILEDSISILQSKARNLLKEGCVKDLEAAYKKLVGALDRYDEEGIKQWKESKTPHQSSYVIRTALLKASHEDGVGLDTWCVYTKSGKPSGSKIWHFIEQGRNWIPEAQGIRAKWIESTIIKTRTLSRTHTENQVVLLKGGFGAGKTRLINEKFGEYANGAIAPDKAKEIDRRSNPDLPHSAAHIHGSQAAYELMKELVNKQNGTLVYDSSLSDPTDVKNYLLQCKSAGKKMVIYDVARNDMARALSVLKRPVDGEDPRIPSEFIIRSAIKDKLNRVDCMEVVLNDDTEKVGGIDHRPEYHFIAGDEKGWNTEEVMVLGPHGKMELKPGAEERLLMEGIKISVEKKKLKLVVDEESLQKKYNLEFEKPVKDIMKDLSEEEQKTLGVFEKRVFTVPRGEFIDNPGALYGALPQNIKNAISQSAFEKAFETVGEKSSSDFFTFIQLKDQFSYVDLPLKVALSIHQNLKTDPWK